MSRNVNLYEIMHGFWKENDYEPFPSSATALFFFLLDRANSRHWKMPVRCPTSLICRAINVSKQTALAARESLMRRGLITFSKGTGKDNLPSYVIVTDPDKWTDSRTDSHTECITGDLTDNQTVSRTPNLTPDLTENLTQYNIKDINIKDKIYPIYKDGEEKILSLDELEVSFMSDTAWHTALLSLLSSESPITEPDLKERITYFFRQLRCQGTDRREEKDCRTHFVNWIKKQLTNNTDGIHKQQWEPDKRRGSGVSATSARDYDGAF